MLNLLRTRRIFRSLILGIVLFLILGSPVLAVPGTIAGFVASPTSTTVNLSWSKASSSTSTVIRYLTTGYPTSATGADGSISVYSGTAKTYTHTGLTSGQTYYYSAWGYDGALYSATAANITITTQGAASTGSTISTPTMPLNIKPDSSAWWNRLQPFTGIVQWFTDDWGMPRDNMNYTFATIILVFIGIAMYLWLKSPLIAVGSVLILDLGLVNISLMPAYSIAYILAIGLGVWALESYSI
jgi:hypothetical protein